MQNLTARQEEVLSLIRNYLEETGYPPTRADIAKHLGFKSANAAEEHLKALAKKGAIEIIPGRLLIISCFANACIASESILEENFRFTTLIYI